jgi:outer membrane biosynthesis protein TonB
LDKNHFKKGYVKIWLSLFSCIYLYQTNKNKNMLTFIILGALSAIIGVWALNKGSKTTTTTPAETKEEEPVGYESGSFASIAVEEPTVPVAVTPKPKKKPASKNIAKNESLAKMEAKPKKAKKA